MTSPPRIPKGSFASSESARARMQSQRRADTAPELALRRALHRLGLRYFVHRRPIATLRRDADVVFPAVRVAVFVDGCFWHGCTIHARGTIRQNTWYWPQKIATNQGRDRDTDARLAAEGWLAIRVWEHEDPAGAAERIRAAVAQRRRASDECPGWDSNSHLDRIGLCPSVRDMACELRFRASELLGSTEVSGLTRGGL